MIDQYAVIWTVSKRKNKYGTLYKHKKYIYLIEKTVQIQTFPLIKMDVCKKMLNLYNIND